MRGTVPKPPLSKGAQQQWGALQDALNRAFFALQTGRLAEAEALYKSVLSKDKKQFDALHMLGLIEAQRGNFAGSLRLLTDAVRVASDLADALVNLGRIQFQLGDHVRAVASYQKALRINPNHALGHSNFSNILRALKRFDEALGHCDKSVQIDPRNADAWNNRGNILYDLRRLDDALTSYERALALDPRMSGAASQIYHLKMLSCDWRDYERQCSGLVDAVRSGAPGIAPFSFLGVPATPDDQFKCAGAFYAQNYPPAVDRLWTGKRYVHDRIRVGYLSADFRNHPVAHLLAGMIERHDRTRFEPIAISLGTDDASEVGKRLRLGFERFVDAREKSDLEVSQLLNKLEVDIAVDLMGYTSGCRPMILARRPAPIQVNYLGFAGTMSVQHMDYVIADRTVIPDHHRRSYSEQVAYLPDCFMGPDSSRGISEQIPTRTELGLPETGIVFCSFNNSYKFAPPIFDIWMRLLAAVPGSALWLSGTREAAVGNLRREAAARGVDGSRIVFAPRVEKIEDHLARQRRADLFLDTLPYNAHSTAVDALYVGLPVVTCLGPAFVGRVGASLVQAAGLPELVAADMAEYETLALKLARYPQLLAAAKAKLATQHSANRLFDTNRYTRNIEAAFTIMRNIQHRGDAPRSFEVEPAV